MKKPDIAKIDQHIISSLRDHIRFLSELISSKSDLIDLLTAEINELRRYKESRAKIHTLSNSVKKDQP